MLRIFKQDAKLFDREWRLQNLYKIRTEAKEQARFIFNPIQRLLFNYAKKKKYRKIRAISPKGRKMGVSTFWLLFYLDDTIFVPNTSSTTIAHRMEDVKKLFRIVKLGYKSVPDEIELSDGRVWEKPKANTDNANEMVFDEINSKITVGLENRGDTNNNLHVSEAAFIKDEGRIKATLGSVPNIEFGSNISAESTANGVGGWFYDTTMDAAAQKGNYDLFFFPWYKDPKHRMIPPNGWTPGELEKLVYQKVLEDKGIKLDIQQLYWWRFTYNDQKSLMDQEFPSRLHDAFLFSGRLAFEKEFINDIVPINPLREFNGLRIYKEPIPGRKYVLGGDPAEGTGNDDSAAEIFDMLTFEQVAEFTSDTIIPAKFAKAVDKFCRLYNNALAVIERNNHGHLVLDRLKDIYGNIYMDAVFDEKKQRTTKKLGWNETGRSRDLALDNLEELIFDMTIKINSGIMKSQLLTFIVNDDGKREAKQGKKDDTILASAIALKVARMPRSAFGVYQLT